MLTALALLLAQTAVQTAPDGTQRWSILADPCAAARTQDEIVVCARGTETTPRLPLPAERGPPDRPMPSNPDVSGAGALAAAQTPCATDSNGCTVGLDIFGAGTALIRGVGKLIDRDSCCEDPGEGTNPLRLVGDAGKAVGRIFKKKPDKSKRVPIPLD